MLNPLVLCSTHPPQPKSSTFKTSLKVCLSEFPPMPLFSLPLESSHNDVSFSSSNAPSSSCHRPCSLYLGPLPQPSPNPQMAISNLTFRLGLVYYHFLRVPSLMPPPLPTPIKLKFPTSHLGKVVFFFKLLIQFIIMDFSRMSICLNIYLSFQSVNSMRTGTLSVFFSAMYLEFSTVPGTVDPKYLLNE